MMRLHARLVDAASIFGQSMTPKVGAGFRTTACSETKTCAGAMEIDALGRVKPLVFSLTALGAIIAAMPAMAGKVHWKDDPAVPGCSALAFDDNDEWFANADGFTFKRGICHGQRIKFKVVLAPDRENFSVSGANFCQFHVGEDHEITAACRPGKGQ